MEKGWVAVIAGAASESNGGGQDRSRCRNGTSSEISSHCTPNHTFRGGLMDCERANKPLWSIVQICVGINGAVQGVMEQELRFQQPWSQAMHESSLSRSTGASFPL